MLPPCPDTPDQTNSLLTHQSQIKIDSKFYDMNDFVLKFHVGGRLKHGASHHHKHWQKKSYAS